MSEETTPKKKPEPAEEKFERDVLVAEATSLLGCPSYVAKVALNKRQGGGPLSLKEAKLAVERLRNSEVKESN